MGDLITTEIRGPQTGADGYGEWIEIYNRSAAAVQLTGLKVMIAEVDGSSTSVFVVRDEDVEVAAGEYVVFGRVVPGTEPEHVDYGYADEYDDELPNVASVDLIACGRLVERTIYRNLPERGTYSFSGAFEPPDDAENDDEDNWCVNETEDVETPINGVRGTPGERNPPCT